MTHAPNQETLALDPLAALEQALGYQFHARALLVQALTHRSFTRDEPTQPHNERLEFLGDAVLQLTVTLRLLDLFPAAGEGELSRFRASLVSAEHLSRIADQLALSPLLRIGRSFGGERSRFRKLTADALEAIIGAIHEDGGSTPATRVILELFDASLLQVAAEPAMALSRDYKTALQELSMKRCGELPTYAFELEGPAHDCYFRAVVSLQGRVLANGRGRTKKEASQHAARGALEILQQETSEDSGIDR